MSALSEMLTAANAEGLSYAEIERRAGAAGFKLSHGTAHVYMTGRHGQVSRQYLEAFVAVFPALRLDDLARAAELPPDLGPYVAPDVASALSGPERDALDTIIKSMAAGKVEISPTQSDLALAAEARKAAASAARRSRKKS